MHPQDGLLIAEALVAFEGSPSNDPPPRPVLAWELATDLLAKEGLGMDALVEDVDDKWSGPPSD